jgi:hypothetical protein
METAFEMVVDGSESVGAPVLVYPGCPFPLIIADAVGVASSVLR